MAKFYLQLYCHTPSADEDAWVDVNALGIHPDLARRLAELGVVDYRRGFIPVRQAARLRRVMRLRQSLGVNLPGAAIIVDLLERVEELQDELERLKG
ncbi:MAG: chaperone modulator CbpM [Firmicutes bacterium]|nr:chaperone modulator CbpM [Bacillota bacterium]